MFFGDRLVKLKKEGVIDGREIYEVRMIEFEGIREEFYYLDKDDKEFYYLLMGKKLKL
jgi:hypothetical protein